MKKNIIAAALILMFLFSAQLLYGQRATAKLEGTIRDTDGLVVTGVMVTASNPETGITWTVTSDDRGHYVFYTLPAGSYDIRLSKPDYQEQLVEGIRLFIGQEINYDFEMVAGVFEETIVITGEAPLVELKKSDVGMVIAQEFIQSIPIVNRTFESLAHLSPGVVPNFSGAGLGTNVSVNAQRGYSNTFLIDGVSNDNARLGFNINSISQDAIQEFDVITQMAPAEYGQAIGGIINIATRSGGNEFHGSAFGFFQDGRLNTLHYYATEKPETSRIMGGFTLGGPIIRDKAHFFFSYEGDDNDYYTFVTQPRNPGQHPAGWVEHLTMVRIDYRPNERDMFNFRFNGTNNTWVNLFVGEWDDETTGWDEVRYSYTFQANYVRWFGTDMVNELRFAYTRQNYKGDPYTESGPFHWHGNGNGGKGLTLPYNVNDSNLQLLDNFTIMTDTHTFKFGADYIRVGNWGANRNWGDGAWEFWGNNLEFDPGVPASYPKWYQRRLGPDDYEVPDNLISFFVQDQWDISDNFTINYGLRWEYEDFFTRIPSKAVLFDGEVSPDLNNFMPRIGFTWRPWEDGNTVIRGGYGRFYNQVPGNQAVFIMINTVNTLGWITIWEDNGIMSYPNPPVIDVLDPSVFWGKDVMDSEAELPKLDQFTIGISHQLTRSTAVHADFTYNRGSQLWGMVNRNARDPVTGLRPDPNWRCLATQSAILSSEYKGLLTRLEHRFPRGVLNVSYTYAYAYDNNRGDPNSAGVTDQFDLDVDWGPSPNDIRHRLVVSGFVELPFGFNVSGVLSYRTAAPYSQREGRDINGDDFTNDRPPGVPKNSERGDNWSTLDLRFTKFFSLDRYRVEFFAEVFNLFNAVNFTSWRNNIYDENFGEPTWAADARTWQLGFRFDF